MSLSRYVVMGRVAGPHGIKGWVNVHSYTSPRENILAYNPWYVRQDGQWQEQRIAEARPQGKGLAVRFEDFTDRNQAEALGKVDIAVTREQLPEIEEGDFYWSDLIGLEVINREQVALGEVDHLIETGANDVLVVKGERDRLIPYIENVVIKVDLVERRILVDWDPEF